MANNSLFGTATVQRCFFCLPFSSGNDFFFFFGGTPKTGAFVLASTTAKSGEKQQTTMAKQPVSRRLLLSRRHLYRDSPDSRIGRPCACGLNYGAETAARGGSFGSGMSTYQVQGTCHGTKQTIVLLRFVKPDLR